MKPTTTRLAYDSTGYFTKIVSDYLNQSPSLQPFYQYDASLEGLQHAIKARKAFQTPRNQLVQVLKEQYKDLPQAKKVQDNIEALLQDNSFTITTAHQPNIFTGPLYFIYKIMHAVKLADELAQQLPEYRFIPVYYMGSEDADLDELGFINLGGQKLVWETKQTGAVGRMKVDRALTRLLHAIEGQIAVLPKGKELAALFKQCYQEGKTIQQATLELVNELFGLYGVVVLVPDHAKLKTAFHATVKKELLEKFSHKAVADTIASLGKTYKVQASGREINLFYLIDDKRERIEATEDGYEVQGLGLKFSASSIVAELDEHPERFSPNVILRGAFQETILPNIAFIGGGGELAYWLELKKVFEAVQVPYPVLVLRNSFLLMKWEQEQRLKKLGFDPAALFRTEQNLVYDLVMRESNVKLCLTDELKEATAYYEKLKQLTGAIDATLKQHVEALEAKVVKRLKELEKKMLRAEKTKFEAQQKQIAKLKQDLFPNNSLQERIENFAAWYATYGAEWLQMIYEVSDGFSNNFVIVTYK
jgi:bacillithiol biosynthesis cysteine-adding enzyme BshC